MRVDLGLNQIQRMANYQRKQSSLACGVRCWVGHDLPPIQSKKTVWEEMCILPKHPKEKTVKLICIPTDRRHYMPCSTTEGPSKQKS